MGDGMQKVDLPRERFETALRAVDGSALWVAAGREQSLAESLTSDEDRIAGLNLLCELASQIIGQCDHAYEMIDALSVLELGWPAWTGGPVAFLAMLQRGEIRNWDPPPALLQAVMAIDHPLKIKASYNAAVR